MCGHRACKHERVPIQAAPVCGTGHVYTSAPTPCGGHGRWRHRDDRPHTRTSRPKGAPGGTSRHALLLEERAVVVRVRTVGSSTARYKGTRTRMTHRTAQTQARLMRRYTSGSTACVAWGCCARATAPPTRDAEKTLKIIGPHPTPTPSQQRANIHDG